MVAAAEHRSHGTRSQTDGVGFVVGRAFWEQRGSVTIRDAPGKVEQVRPLRF